MFCVYICRALFKYLLENMTSTTQCLPFIPSLFPNTGILTGNLRPFLNAILKYKAYIIKYIYSISHHLFLTIHASK